MRASRSHLPRPRRWLMGAALLPILALAPAASAAGAQDPAGGAGALESFDEEVSVEVVNVQVWVTDRQGRPVTGLTREDFQLLEDGEPVAITNFTAVEAAPAPEPVETGEPADAGSPDVVLARQEVGSAPENERRLVVFVDDWNLRPEDRRQVFDDLERFVGVQVQGGIQTMVVLHDGAARILQPFTGDPRAVDRTLARIRERAPSGVQLTTERRGALQAILEAYTRAIDAGSTSGGLGPRPSSYGGTDPCRAHWGDMLNAVESYAATIGGRVQGSMGALATVTDVFAGLPGQKVLLYVGNGMEQQPGLGLYRYLAQICPARQSDVALAETRFDLTGGFRQLTSRANAHGVTFYTLEAEGPAGEIDMSIQGGSAREPARSGTEIEGGDGIGRSSARSLSVGPTPETGGETLRPSAAVERVRAGNLEGSLFMLANETGGRAPGVAALPDGGSGP